MKVDASKIVEFPKPERPAEAELQGVAREFSEEAERMRRDITDEIYEGQFLRDEAAQLSLWIATNSGKPWWGESQEAYAARARETLRASTATWKLKIDARQCSAAALRNIFETRHGCSFDLATVDAGRKVLGI